MGRDEVAHHLKPEDRHLGEHAALAGNAIRQDAIERGNPVGRDNQELLLAKRIYIPDFSGCEMFYAGQTAFK